MARRRCWCTATLLQSGRCSDPYCAPEMRAPHRRLQEEAGEARAREKAAELEAKRGFPQIDQVRRQLQGSDPSFAAECERRSTAARRRRRIERANKAQAASS